MGGSRGVRIGFDSAERRLYVLLPAEELGHAPTGAYVELDVSLKSHDSGRVLEISTTSTKYFREFHRLATLLTEEFERDGQSSSGAFAAAVEAWQDLVSERSILTQEQQTGLAGELLVLSALVDRNGPSAVDAWVGRDPTIPNRHDFRIQDLDLEIKCTRGTSRKHFVHGLQQLVPAPGHRLFVLSFRLEPAGALSGRSLAEQVSLLRSKLSPDTDNRRTFDRKLASMQYREVDARYYSERLSLADRPVLVPVNDFCPRIIRELLIEGLTSEVAMRIDQVTYQVNLEGLGFDDTSLEFLSVLPDIRIDFE